MNRQELVNAKQEFYKECLQKESKIIQEKAERCLGGSFWSMYSGHNYPDADEARLARKDHNCLNTGCKKKIKKGRFYFRRSFGQLWTIKACSIKCFLEELSDATSGG